MPYFVANGYAIDQKQDARSVKREGFKVGLPHNWYDLGLRRVPFKCVLKWRNRVVEHCDVEVYNRFTPSGALRKDALGLKLKCPYVTVDVAQTDKHKFQGEFIGTFRDGAGYGVASLTIASDLQTGHLGVRAA